MKRKSSHINLGLVEFTRRLYYGGGISLKGLVRLPLYYIQLIPALPLAMLQRALFGKQIENTLIHKEPIFILGHFRSGTSYLQKLMASTRQFAFLTNYDCLFPNSNLLFGKKTKSVIQRLLIKLKIKNPFFNNTLVDLNEPGEEDDFLMNKGSVYTAYWGLIFPRRWREWLQDTDLVQSEAYVNGWKAEYLKTLKYITWKSNGKQLILKNPPNTGRIRVLLELFPNAKFIYLYRNPYHVFYSMRNMWMNAILNNYSVQDVSKEDLHEIIFNYFSNLTDSYNREKSMIPPGNLIELSYERLKENPYSTVQKVYESLTLPDFQKTSQHLLKHIEAEKHYQNFSYQFDEYLIQEIGKRWKKYIEEEDKVMHADDD